jgi:hypothetical protein
MIFWRNDGKGLNQWVVHTIEEKQNIYSKYLLEHHTSHQDMSTKPNLYYPANPSTYFEKNK